MRQPSWLLCSSRTRTTTVVLLALAAASFLQLRVLEALQALDVVLDIHKERDHLPADSATREAYTHLLHNGSSADQDAKSTSLVRRALPNCSVVFFHHLEKSAGTTLRSIFQRQSQLGDFDSLIYIGRLNKQLNQLVLHQLTTLIRTPGGLTGLRLLVEIHIGGNRDHPYFLKYTLPDLLLLRQQLRAAGCRCNLVTLLRHPLLQHLSWHFHFCNHRVPLCFWSNPSDCQSRMAMAMTCHDGPNLTPLDGRHRKALEIVWNTFDLVGVTEYFDEFVLLLADLVGLQAPVYRAQQVASETLWARNQTAEWTAWPCAQLVANPPDELMEMLRRRLQKSAANAAAHLRRKGRSSTRGAPGTMECRGYGPCEVPGWHDAQRVHDGLFNASLCSSVTPQMVLQRLCSRMQIDEATYLQARRRFRDQVLVHGAKLLEVRLRLLRAAGERLQRRATEQAAVPLRSLEQAVGAQLQRAYVATSGSAVGGNWGPVDEFAPIYLPHERARFSCVNCSGDVVPAKDLIGCWPLWPQFAPDELRYRCERTWTADPGWHRPKDFLEGGARLPCWRTCWRPSKDEQGHSRGREHCTPACPSASEGVPAVEWRRKWDATLADFNAARGVGRDLHAAMAFVQPHQHSAMDFMWRVY